jgi:Putative mono-oxygenase ydhR
MAQKLVQVDFVLAVSAQEYTQAIAPLAQAVADLAGLQWKIWLVNDVERAAGGIYLFADESSARSFLRSSFLAQLRIAPFLRDVRVQQFDVLTHLTEITRGPLSTYAEGL